MSAETVLLWLRQDLRLADYPALKAAVESGAAIVPVYILDDETPGDWRLGGASRWWLHHSLAALADDLAARGSRLVLRQGRVADVLPELAAETGATTVYVTRSYEPWAVALERDLNAALGTQKIAMKRYGGALLFEPDAVRTKQGEPYRVYTPFWRAVSAEPVRGLEPPPQRMAAPARWPRSDRLSDWALLPTRPDWAKGFAPVWTPGEAGARARLVSFLDAAVATYDRDRNRPDMPGTSRLSPHLHFGEIAPHACWHAARDAAARHRGGDKGIETFCKELVWREFSYHLLFNWPSLPEAPFRPEFAQFPWREDAGRLEAWQRGLTGYPIVDAGMRELWATGWMHNRVRMIVASFLVKDMLIPWQAGEAWFWDCLVDADLASNAASWQWVAGSGADAAPYFRIFNPVKQGETHDPDGAHVRRWVPEIARLPDAHLNAPWLAPQEVLASAGVALGKTYPLPILDHHEARDQALAAYQAIRA